MGDPEVSHSQLSCLRCLGRGNVGYREISGTNLGHSDQCGGASLEARPVVLPVLLSPCSPPWALPGPSRVASLFSGARRDLWDFAKTLLDLFPHLVSPGVSLLEETQRREMNTEVLQGWFRSQTDQTPCGAGSGLECPRLSLPKSRSGSHDS